MNSTLSAALGGWLLAAMLAPLPPANANPLASRTLSKNELIKRCMQKSMSERRELHYNDAAKECAAQVQVQLQSNAAGQTAAAKSPAASTT